MLQCKDQAPHGRNNGKGTDKANDGINDSHPDLACAGGWVHSPVHHDRHVHSRQPEGERPNETHKDGEEGHDRGNDRAAANVWDTEQRPAHIPILLGKWLPFHGRFVELLKDRLCIHLLEQHARQALNK